MIYDLLAPFYDGINKDLDYSKWADFIEEIISQEFKSGKPDLVLDLACGTGRMTIELAKRGYDMTGVDYSPEMLNEARIQADKCGFDGKILWLCQDMCEFELYGTVDVAVCCLDSINHLTDNKSLKKTLFLVHNYLIPDGLFIFDVNGKNKFETVYADRSYVMEENNTVCVWQNYYNSKNGICNFYISVFEEQKDGSYIRHDEIQREKMYTVRSIKAALKESGFEFIGAYSDFDFSEGTDKNDRIYFVARCIK